MHKLPAATRKGFALLIIVLSVAAVSWSSRVFLPVTWHAFLDAQLDAFGITLIGWALSSYFGVHFCILALQMWRYTPTRSSAEL